MAVEKNQHDGYEKRDVNVAKAILACLLMVVFLVISVIAVNEIFLSVKENYYYQAVLAPQSQLLRDQRAREDEALTTYRVVDSGKGVYQVPVSRAMELLAQESFQAKMKSPAEVKK